MSRNATQTAVFVHEIGTAVPEHSYSQEFAREFMSSLPAYDEKARRFLERIYRGTAIEKRHTVIGDYGKDPSEYIFYPKSPDLLPEPTVEQRNELYIRESNRLAVLAVEALFHRLDGFDLTLISHLITVSCTGFSAPGFDIHLQRTLGLSPGLHRLHLGFMGCYAALPALRTAADICRSSPEARVLVVALELCSLHFQQKADREIMVANSLFADGVGAALVSAVRGDSGPDALRLDSFASRYLEGSEQDMAWKLGPVAFDMRLSAYVPRLIQANIGAILDGLLGRSGRRREEIALWALHPGGRAIMDRVAATLGLTDRQLWASYQVLREYGNMSSATILFVLELILRRPGTGPVFAAAFGPGLTVESALMERLV